LTEKPAACWVGSLYDRKTIASFNKQAPWRFARQDVLELL
jgi:hypothetical protein